jgi:hypothetical protein
VPSIAVAFRRIGPLPLGIKKRSHPRQFGSDTGVFHL